MKYLLFLPLLLPTVTLGKIYTVDNTPGNGAMYNTIAAAVSAASSGDTIIVMPSSTKYDNVAMDKKLFIYSRSGFGGSFEPDRSAFTPSIQFWAGSSGSKVSGFFLSPGSVEIGISGTVNNIEVSNCFLNATNVRFQNGSSNVRFINNVFSEVRYHQYFIDFGNSSNNIVRNNYFVTVCSGSYASNGNSYFIGGNSTNIITNNLICESMLSGGSCSDGGFVFFRGTNAKIYNNIIWSNVNGRTSFDTLSGGNFANNLTYSAKNKLPNLSGSGNMNDTFPSFETNFTDSKPPGVSSSDNFRLKSGTVGKNAGLDSTDVGLFGGGHTYSSKLLVTGVPIIDQFMVLTPVVKRGGKLKVKLIARKPEN